MFNILYEQLKNKIPGGLADKKDPSNYDPEQLRRGIEVELEHTDDREIAQEIAMDHLEEFPTYYTALDNMEKGLKKKQE